MRSRTGIVAGVLAGLLVGAPGTTHAQAPPELRTIFTEDFSRGAPGWEKVRLDRRSTVWGIAEMGSDRVLQASSRNANTAFVRPIEAGMISHGRLSWRWRVANSFTDNDREREKAGDDYAARVFVLFGDAGFGRDTRAIAYVWAGREPVGSRYPNPYVANVGTVVVESGDAHAREWRTEERDIVADYQAAFGDRPGPLAAIAIVVDTDNTDRSAVAWFDDFALSVAP